MTAYPRTLTRLRGALAAVLCVASLGGCSLALPTDPTPRAGRAVAVQPRQDVQWFLPGPQPGAEPAEIVRGFLRANLAYGNGDDDVARTFLTEDLARQWVPTSNVLVYRDSPAVVARADGDVTAQVEVAGRIDGDGQLVEEPAGTVTTQGFGLTLVDGEWRISSFPEGFGLWLSRADLESGFRESTVYRLAAGSHSFVPDNRWLPRGVGLPMALGRAQLSAPAPYLEGAVAETPGLGLTVSSVPVSVDTQQATVSLTGARLDQVDDEARKLWAQLTRTLVAVPGITSVDLMISGRPVEVAGVQGPATASTDLGYRDAERTVDLALLRVGAELVPVDPTRYDLREVRSVRAAALQLPEIGQDWGGLAASADLGDLAAVSGGHDKIWRWRDGRVHVNSAIGDELTEPSFLGSQELWVAGLSRSQQRPRVWVVDDDDLAAVARPLQLPWLQDHERIRSFRVSPDGARAALVVGIQGSRLQRLVLTGIVRDSRGRAVSLTEPLAAAPTLTDVRAARWATPGRLVVVGRRSEDSVTAPFEVPIGGWTKPLPAQAGLVDLVPVPVGDSYRPVARTDDGRFHTAEGSSGWYDARNGDELVIPGS